MKKIILKISLEADLMGFIRRRCFVLLDQIPLFPNSNLGSLRKKGQYQWRHN